VKKYPRNEPCPCGSGKKYKKCCWDKGFTWAQDEEGDVVRQVPLSDDALAALDELRTEFVRKHGREPGSDDKLFDGLPHSEIVELEMVQAMKKAGIEPAKIYAFEHTGLLVTEDNQHLISDQDLAEWGAAIEEFKRRQASGESSE